MIMINCINNQYYYYEASFTVDSIMFVIGNVGKCQEIPKRKLHMNRHVVLVSKRIENILVHVIQQELSNCSNNYYTFPVYNDIINS